ncbi:kinase-like domain-containing protein, partial [Parasitella parasitica]
RDIKPDNILLDQDGHVHLSDFNIACSIPEKHEKPLISLSGTAAYFAPEYFKHHGYNEDVDWWSLGITFYECIYGKVRKIAKYSLYASTNTIYRDLGYTAQILMIWANKFYEEGSRFLAKIPSQLNVYQPLNL